MASVVSDSLRPYGQQPARLFCPWDSAGKNTGVGCHVLVQGYIRVYIHIYMCIYIHAYIYIYLAFLVAQTEKNLCAMWETWVLSLSWKDPLEEGMAIHSSTLAWRIPMDRGAWRATVRGVAKSQTQLSD